MGVSEVLLVPKSGRDIWSCNTHSYPQCRTTTATGISFTSSQFQHYRLQTAQVNWCTRFFRFWHQKS